MLNNIEIIERPGENTTLILTPESLNQWTSIFDKIKEPYRTELQADGRTKIYLSLNAAMRQNLKKSFEALMMREPNGVSQADAPTDYKKAMMYHSDRADKYMEELETLRLQLAAMCNTEQSIKAQRISPESPYYIASYDLLQSFCEFLEEHGYIDVDWRAERPTAIDQFLKRKS